MPAVLHKTLDLDGVRIFYREAGPPEAPVILLPHGYPCSSFQFRAFMPALAGPGIDEERIRFGGLDQFFTIAADDAQHEYTVAWVDCLSRGRCLGRGVYLRGAHHPLPADWRPLAVGPRVRVPCDAPSALLNRLTISAFNHVHYRRTPRGRSRRAVPFGV